MKTTLASEILQAFGIDTEKTMIRSALIQLDGHSVKIILDCPILKGSADIKKLEFAVRNYQLVEKN
jgi:hypothetical protein